MSIDFNWWRRKPDKPAMSLLDAMNFAELKISHLGLQQRIKELEASIRSFDYVLPTAEERHAAWIYPFPTYRESLTSSSASGTADAGGPAGGASPVQSTSMEVFIANAPGVHDSVPDPVHKEPDMTPEQSVVIDTVKSLTTLSVEPPSPTAWADLRQKVEALLVAEKAPGTCHCEVPLVGTNYCWRCMGTLLPATAPAG